MQKGIILMALFTGLFVGIVVFLIQFVFPGIDLLFRLPIIAVAALIGGYLGNKWFVRPD